MKRTSAPRSPARSSSSRRSCCNFVRSLGRRIRAGRRPRPRSWVWACRRFRPSRSECPRRSSTASTMRSSSSRGRQASRHGRAGRPQGQAHLCRRRRLPGQGRRQADGAGFHVPHLFDDQAAGLGRRHDAGRGRQDPAHRSGVEVLSGVQGPAGQRGAQPTPNSRA